MNKDQLVGLIGLLLGVLLYSLAGDSESYLFPRVIAMVMALLGLAILVTNFTRRSIATPIPDQAETAWLRILPVIALFLVFPWAMQVIGFYLTGFTVFLTIAWCYAPEPFSMGAAVKRIAITAIFFLTVFIIFSVVLDVQIPRGLLF